MGGGSTPKNTTTTVTNQPPEWLKPYATSMMSGAANLASQPYNPYPGTSFASITPEQQAAQYGIQRRAVMGSPANLAAQNQLVSTLQGQGQGPSAMDWVPGMMETARGDNLYGNPWLGQAIAQAQAEQIPGIGFMSRQGGSYGNTGIAEAAARNMGNIAGQMRFQNYSQERDRQMNALGQLATGWDTERQRQMAAAQMAPQLAETDYRDLQMLMGVGDSRRGYQQEALDYARGAWDASTQWPYSQMDWFGNVLRGAGFGTGFDSTTSAPNPNAPNPMATAIGAGLTGASLFDILSGLGR